MNTLAVPFTLALLAVASFCPTSACAQTKSRTALPAETPPLREWKEQTTLHGRPTLITGQQWVHPKTGRELTRYLDPHRRPLPDKFNQARQKTWDAIPPIEAASETHAAPPLSAPPPPASLQANLPFDQTTVTLPAPDLTRILEEDKHAAASKAGRRVGLRRPLPKPVQPDALPHSWLTLPDGSLLWTATLRSTDAHALRVRFQDVHLPNGARLTVFNPEHPQEAVGPYDAHSATADGGFWSGTIFSDRVVIECLLPPGTPAHAASFRLIEVVHRYQPWSRLPGTPDKLGPCHNDVTCYPGWAIPAAAVGGIGVIGAAGELYCTGTLLADLDPATSIGYFLTAAHCITDQVEADTSEFYWFYQTSVCDGLAPSPALVPRTGGGAELLATMTGEQGNDFTLVRIRNDHALPSGVTFAGWTTAQPDPNEDLTVIHHPDGSHKRLSTGRLVGTSANYWDVVYTSGSTEYGSSGSPLFNADQKIIGQLQGGDASCNNPQGTDTYGRFAVTYPIIERWLLGQPITVPNDAFADAQTLSGPNGQIASSTSGATKEPGEPNHANDDGGRSIWFRWVAPGDGPFTFHTQGSAFDTLLAVYTGSAVQSLTLVAGNDDGPAAPASELFFNAASGSTYFIAVDGYGGAAGPVTLHWEPADEGIGLNDHFANAQTLVGANGWTLSSNVGASAEPGEPDHAAIPVGRSVWFRWTAPRPQTVMFDTEDSDFDTVLAVYTGPSVNQLTWVADNDDIDFNNDIYTSRVFFRAEADTTYYLAVDGWYDEDFGSNETGEILLTWYQDSDVAILPANDAFADARVLTGPSGQTTGSNDFATLETSEPVVEANPGGASVWFRWTAPASGLATFSTADSRFDTVLGVFRGDALSSLTLLGSSDDLDAATVTSLTTVAVTAGTEYRIVIDGYFTESDVIRAGDYTLAWSICPDCGGNDLFANAQTLTGVSGQVFGTTVGATLEPGEPPIAGNTGGQSVWYRWTAPATGLASFDTLGSSFDTLLAVYTGSKLAALQLVNANDDYGIYVQSGVDFTATAGTEYRIAVAGYRFSSGTISAGSVRLTWRQPNATQTQLGQPRVTPADTFQFEVSGLPGATYEIERSSDWSTWTKVGSVLIEGGPATFTDPDPIRGARFYRAKSTP